MKRYKPRIKLTGPYNFEDVDYLYKCSGLGWNGYGETVEESYQDWIEILKLVNWSAFVFVSINNLAYKFKRFKYD